MYKLVKKTIKKEDRVYVNVFLITEDGVRIPLQVKKFGKKKQDFFRECKLEENCVEE